jgi:hypothetical protein
VEVGAWTNAPMSLDGPETVIRMIIQANAEMDFKVV